MVSKVLTRAEPRPTGSTRSTTLRVSEVFASIQGESSRIGLPTVFVRLTGCPLRCVWCDTEYAFTGGRNRPIDELVEEIRGFGIPTICVTGGEPLAQKECRTLLRTLCDAGFSVSLETSGALDIDGIDARVARIVDLKAPGSGECERNRLENIALLRPTDEVKFVLADETDYAWAKRMIIEHRLGERCPVLMSPVHGSLDPTALAELIVQDRLPVRFQMQLHKILWADARGK
ncbi:7-carboxy-7-deazaguanine synthase QueE [Azoarcus taiwanensis]|uniref:7-carboxy-7-deazaguanine synthase n=1 Tax=Azoarcus taiwanensis TaxID=666964 RepID=A0A972JBG3_9RHOO|nr:7-carboxy-7-deazaguanine synthase QueE [Azoarcus taiwanensis]